MSSLPQIPTTRIGGPDSDTTELAHQIVDLISDRQGSDIVLMDLRDVSLLADYFILASADSRRQIRAIQDNVHEALHKGKISPLRIEGTPESGWVIMDYGPVVVHLFDPEARAFYKLESLWKNAPVVLHIQ